MPSFRDEASKASWIQFGTDLDDVIPDDTALEEFFHRLVAVIEGWPVHKDEEHDLAPFLADIKEKLLPSLRSRVLALGALSSLSTLPAGVFDPDVSPTELVAEWRTKNQQGAAHESPLARILVFLRESTSATHKGRYACGEGYVFHCVHE